MERPGPRPARCRRSRARPARRRLQVDQDVVQRSNPRPGRREGTIRLETDQLGGDLLDLQSDSAPRLGVMASSYRSAEGVGVVSGPTRRTSETGGRAGLGRSTRPPAAGRSSGRRRRAASRRPRRSRGPAVGAGLLVADLDEAISRPSTCPIILTFSTFESDSGPVIAYFWPWWPSSRSVFAATAAMSTRSSRASDAAPYGARTTPSARIESAQVRALSMNSPGRRWVHSSRGRSRRPSRQRRTTRSPGRHPPRRRRRSWRGRRSV